MLIDFEEPAPPAVSARRITIARQCNGWTKKVLAAKLGVSPMMVGKYESGSQPTDVELLSSTLGFPATFFYGDEGDTIPEEAISFRSRWSLTLKTKEQILGRGWLASTILSPAFRKRFRMPKLDLPTWPEHRSNPELAARLLRSHWNLGHGPIPNLVHLVEAKGIEVYWTRIGSNCVDAVSYRRNAQPYIFLNTHKVAGERSRFDLAHELGHLVLHLETTNLIDKDAEKAANIFASSFLMPKEHFGMDIPRFPTVDKFLPVKSKWGVSLQAAVYRTHYLNRMSTVQYKNTYTEISRRYGLTNEPGQLPREESRLHQLIYSRLAEKRITTSAFAQSLSIPFDSLAELTPIAEEYRHARSGELRLIVDEP